MTFLPALPATGYVGWKLLKRTADQQMGTLSRQPVMQRNEAYFREKIGNVTTAAELVADRRLLQVALGAFGLEGDLGNKAFIQKVLEGGTLAADSLANRLASKSYAQLSAAFGFGDFKTPRSKLSDFPDKILAAFKAREFEKAVGLQNNDMRLALNAERELATLAGSSSSNDAKWYAVLGSIPLRRVFEKALGLPTSFGTLDIDRQLVELKERSKSRFGSDNFSDFKAPETTDRLIKQFLIRSEIDTYRSGFGANPALSLMSQALIASRSS